MKNAEHPLVKLRKALSTENQEMTRELFSKRVGIPASSLKAIETGKYKLKPEVAAKIAAATKVDPKCLMDPSLPLADYLGDPLIKGEKSLADYLGDKYKEIRALFDAAIDAAQEEQKQVLFSFLFLQWFEKTSKILGLRSAITDELLKEYPLQCFWAIPKYVWPNDHKIHEDLVKQIKRFEDEFLDRYSVQLSKALKNHAPGILRGLIPALEPLMIQLEKAKPGAARKKILLQFLRIILVPFKDALDQKDLSLGKFLWDAQREMINEAKASKPV